LGKNGKESRVTSIFSLISTLKMEVASSIETSVGHRIPLQHSNQMHMIY